jgi:uncharacterized membrane protein YdbT with pleckstrin-like domain
MGMHEDETTIWAGTPSHVKDLPFHLVCGALAWLIVPIGLMAWRFLGTRFHEYEITSERIRLTRGILSRRMDELELYRVKDTSIEQPLMLRLFGLSNVVVRSSDTSTPIFVIEAVPDAQMLRENLRGCVEKMRERKRVREVDYA